MNRVVIATLTLTMMASAESTFTGNWEGKMNDLPGVDLTLRDDSGNVSGSIAFYFRSRGNDGKWHVGGKYTEPLLAPQTDGKILTFEVRHRKFIEVPSSVQISNFASRLVAPMRPCCRNWEMMRVPLP